GPCRTHMEQIQLFWICFTTHFTLRDSDAHAQTAGIATLHSRADEGVGCAAILRRDEGCAGSRLEIGHPPADHGARGTRFHSPPAEPGPRAGSHQTAGGLERRPATAPRLL